MAFAPFPPATYLSDGARTEGEMKTAFENWLLATQQMAARAVPPGLREPDQCSSFVRRRAARPGQRAAVPGADRRAEADQCRPLGASVYYVGLRAVRGGAWC